jgi:molybdate-binding protein/DNA-binding XRE family transcriptional regulator
MKRRRPRVAARKQAPAGERHLVESRVRAARLERGLSQAELAEAAGLTRQAVYSIESNHYLPNVTTALRLARTLNRRVEDLFGLEPAGTLLDGDLLGQRHGRPLTTRAKVWSVGERTLVLPVASLGVSLTYSTPADGLIVGPAGPRGRSGGTRRVRVQLLQDERVVRQQVVVAGCDPAIQLVAERLRQHREPASVLGWPMGSTAAVEALKRGEVHIAGLHIMDPRSGEANVPFVRRHLGAQAVALVTFASWEVGLLVKGGNPKAIGGPADLVRKDVRLVNREEGSGARLLLDQRLKGEGIRAKRVRGYCDVVSSHLDVGRRIAEGAADLGVGVEAIARLLGLGFIPLQTERYDLVIPSAFLTGHPGVGRLLEALVSREVRAEIEALGGYSTRDTGKVVEQPPARRRTAR